MFLNCKFEDKVVVNQNEVFENCEFVSGSTPKEKGVFALSIQGDADCAVKACKFASKGYSSIYMNSTGKIDIEDSEFDCTGNYNPIEGGSSKASAKLTGANIKNNVLNGICGNNYINIYSVEDGAVFNIEGNVIKDMSQQAECLRLSNIQNNSAEFNLKGLTYSYDMGTEFDADWTKAILLQDYSNGEVQDFSKFQINCEDFVCNGVAVEDANAFPVGGLFVVYDQYKSADGENAITEANDPVIFFNGVAYARPVEG